MNNPSRLAPKVEFEEVEVDVSVVRKEKYIDEIYKDQYNSIEDIRKQIAKYYVEEKGGASDVAAKAVEDLRRAEKKASGKGAAGAGRQIPVSGGDVRAVGGDDKLFHRARNYNGSGKIIGRSFFDDLVNTGKVNLTGNKFNDITELAAFSHVFRNPRFETFRIIYTIGVGIPIIIYCQRRKK